MSNFGFADFNDSATVTRWPLITFDNLGEKDKIKKGKKYFVPLFGNIPNKLPKDVNKEDLISIEETVQTRFAVFMWKAFYPNGEGGRTVRSIEWIDSKLRKGKRGAIVDDLGVQLGLDLSQGERKHIPGFGVDGVNFPEKNQFAETRRVPVLWDVELTDNGDVKSGTGFPALLEVKEMYFNQIADLLAKVQTKKFIWSDGDDEQTVTSIGIGTLLTFDKDTSRGFKTYEISTAKDMAALPSDVMEYMADARERMTSYAEWRKENQGTYAVYIEMFNNGEIGPEEAQKLVIAHQAKEFLDFLGIEYTDEETDTILNRFEEIREDYSMEAGANLAAAIKSTRKVNVDSDSDDELPF